MGDSAFNAFGNYVIAWRQLEFDRDNSVPWKTERGGCDGRLVCSAWSDLFLGRDKVRPCTLPPIPLSRIVSVLWASNHGACDSIHVYHESCIALVVRV